MKDEIVILKPGDKDYPAGFGCGICNTDDKPIAIGAICLKENKKARLGDTIHQGICVGCAQAVIDALSKA